MLATALTWPVFSAMSAMATGTISRIAEALNAGRCRPGRVGRCPAAARSRTRRRRRRGRRAGASTRRRTRRAPVIGPSTASRSSERTNPTTRPTSTPSRPSIPRPATAVTITTSIVISATRLVLGPVRAGDDRGEVEADEQDHRAGHGGRQDRRHGARAAEVHREPDERDDDAAHRDRAGDLGARARRPRAPRRRPRRTTRSSRGSWARGPRVISRNSIVASPESRIARLGSSPMSTGKTNVAPNMASTCCAPRPTVRPHDSRSSGRTTSPGAGARPSPCTVHPLITGDRLGLRRVSDRVAMRPGSLTCAGRAARRAAGRGSAASGPRRPRR